MDDVAGGPTARSRETTASATSDAFATPALGTYVYDVDGYEEATAFGRRSYPEEMHMTVHRSQPSAEDVPKLEPNEMIFDLDFSSEHEEREIVAFDETGVSFTYEAGSVTFGPVTRTSEATYEPPMLQVPLPLTRGARRSGTSEATTPDGEHARTEDWTVEVGGRELLPVLGEQRETWVVRIERASRPGSSEQVERSRTYWVDTDLGIWVQWTEELDGSQALGPGTFRYRTEFTATLDRIEPL